MKSVNPPPAAPVADVGTLRQEIRQRTPFSSIAEEAHLTLQRTVDDLTSAFAALFREHDLTPTQYNALRIVRGAGEEGLSTHEVGERLIKREPDVPRLLERLANAGLISRSRSGPDRRVTSCLLTPRGRRVLELLDQPVRELHRSQFAALSAEEQTMLVQLLQKVGGR
jgi:DNA-binding MarR family transcriptional regulator